MGTKSNSSSTYGNSVTYTYDRNGNNTGTSTVHQAFAIENFDRTIDGSDAPPPFESPTSLTYVKVTHDYMKGWRESWTDPRWWPVYRSSRFEGYYSTVTLPVHTDYDDMAAFTTEDAISRFWGKVRDSNLNLAQDLAEYKETTKLVRDFTRFITGGLKKNLVRLAKSFRDDPLEVASNAWLAYVYGIRPTMQTLHDLAMFEARAIDKPVRIKARRAGLSVVNETIGSKSWKSQRSYRIEIGATLRIPDNDTIARLSSLDPTSIAWELLPYSFVLDWIVNIGQYLENLEAERRFSKYLSNNYITESTKQTVDQDDAKYVLNVPYGGSDTIWHYVGRYERITCSRQLNMEPPTASYPRLRMPRLGYSRITSLASLLYQLVPKGAPRK